MFLFYTHNNHSLFTCCTVHLQQPVRVNTVNDCRNKTSILHILHLLTVSIIFLLTKHAQNKLYDSSHQSI